MPGRRGNRGRREPHHRGHRYREDRRNEDDNGRLVEEIGPRGRRRLIFEYRGRRFDVTRFFDLNPIVPDPPPPTVDQLKVDSVDLKVSENRLAHRTDRYEVTDLILRRGQEFSIALKLNRPFKAEEDVITVEFRTGNHPLISRGTLVHTQVVDKFEPNQWGYQIETANGKDLLLIVKSAVNCSVGEYQLDVLTHVLKDGKKEKEYRKELAAKVYFLFNAWCKDDTVYMESEEEKDEYVLNDVGYLYYGTSRYLGKMHWNFGQYDADVFKCVLYLLENNLDVEHRNNSVVMCRTMSAAVNVQDDGGVLHGRWDGEYSDGAKPTSWQGSVAILEQYLATKEAVKYGQCWVFSGVLTTVMRCLGIPTRSITNFSSAHDTDRSVTIDECVDQNDDMIEELNYDSVWNFHVWNDCWMSRPDLPVGFGGWQAIDATPQETSEGIFQTGPASLNAIKQGLVYLPYDAPFVFAEVNADRVYWQCEMKYGDWDMKKISTTTSSIGKNISTKAVGSSTRHDITDQYKYSEFSSEERVAVRRAIQYGSRPEIVEDEVTSADVTCELVNKDVLMLGDDFAIEVNLKNSSNAIRTVDLACNLQVCYYTGVRAELIKKERQTLVLSAGETSTALIKATVAEYLDKLVEQSQFKVFILGKVKETNQLLADQDDFRLETPDLEVKLTSKGAVRVGQAFRVSLSFTNPLNKKITGCLFMTEGPGLAKANVEKFRDINPKEVIHHEVSLTPRNPGKRSVLAEFDCDQFENVLGELEVDIKA